MIAQFGNTSYMAGIAIKSRGRIAQDGASVKTDSDLS